MSSSLVVAVRLSYDLIVFWYLIAKNAVLVLLATITIDELSAWIQFEVSRCILLVCSEIKANYILTAGTLLSS